ncbi:MAG: OadG family transporter subunit [Methylococcales bacterium]
MNEMMSAGLELMLIGMGIVFAFLAMLVVMVSIMTSVIQRFFPTPSVPDVMLASASAGHTDAGVIAAISVAVHQYRNKHK